MDGLDDEHRWDQVFGADGGLEPQDWQALRDFTHGLVDDLFRDMSSLREQPAWQPVPETLKQIFSSPAPQKGEGLGSTYKLFRSSILPYNTGNRHPRSWGWVRGSGIVTGVLADFLAAAMNTHAGGGDNAATLVEAQVVRWIAELVAYPLTASGLMTSGGSLANILGLVVARRHMAGFDVRSKGIQSWDKRLILYCSTETHHWSRKAVEALGLGRTSLVEIPVDADYRLNIPMLRERLHKDLLAGLQPFAVIANVGTVNTGAIDPLEELAIFCREHHLWLHADGALGAFAALSPKYKNLVEGLRHADSVALDLHKWMYLPIGVGCLLVKNSAAHQDTFATSSKYLAAVDRGVLAGGMTFADLGLELTRPFRALKAWMAIKVHGAETFARAIEKNIDDVQYLETLIKQDPYLESLAPRVLNVVCFRYKAPLTSEPDLNALNKEIILRIQESGRFIVSETTLQQKTAIRVANVNHRSHSCDFAALVKEIAAVAEAITGSLPIEDPDHVRGAYQHTYPPNEDRIASE